MQDNPEALLALGDFNPGKLAAAQRDEIEITITREQAELIGLALSVGLETAPDDAAEQAVIDDVFEMADRLTNFARTGIDHPDAVFCVSCGQPDEPELHDPSKCAAALRARASLAEGKSA